MEEITPTEFMALSRREVIERCEKWKNEFNNGKMLKVNNPRECPIAQWVAYNDKKCDKELVANTASCPICGSPVCPDCMNHNIEQISRVTGYLSTVSGWNAAKKQEFADREKYDLNR